MKIGVISSLGRGTGAALRGEYFVRGLKKNKVNVNFFKPHPKIGANLEHILFVPYNIIRTIFKRFDYLLVLKPFPTGCMPAIINRFFRRTKIIVDIDDLDSAYRKGLLARTIEKVQKTLVPRFDLLCIQYNEDLIRYVQKEWKIPKERIITVEQGVDLELFNPKKYDRQKTRKKLGLKDEKVLCFTGHLGYTAIEIDMLLEIMKNMKKEGRADVKLLVVGGGSRLNEFKEKAQKYGITKEVHFSGQVSPKTCAEMINAADVCVCYYAKRKANYYRNSMKVREYLAMGKRVVCTDIGDLMKFSKMTIQTPPNPTLFQKSIIKTIGEKETKKKMLNRQKFIRDNFNWKTISKDFIAQIKAKEK